MCFALCTLGHNFNLCFEDCFLTYFAAEKLLKREFAFATSNFLLLTVGILILYSDAGYASNTCGILHGSEEPLSPAAGFCVTSIKFLVLPSLARAHITRQRWERRLYWWINGVLIFLSDLHKEPIVQAGGGGQNSSHNWAASYESLPACP